MRLALYEPDIPQNAGAVLRLGACLGVAIDIIEPCGFVLDDRRLKRAGMDYIARADWVRHGSWARFSAARGPGRLVLLTTQGELPYHRFAFAAGDTLLLGRETAGVPPDVHARGRRAPHGADGGGRALAERGARGRDRAGRGAAADWPAAGETEP